MQLFILFIQIAVGFFAAVGVYFFFSRVIFDWYVQKKSSAVCKIYLFSCKSDPEYAVRFAESRFLKGDYAVFFDGLVISDDIDIDPQLFDRLYEEFVNITVENLNNLSNSNKLHKANNKQA